MNMMMTMMTKNVCLGMNEVCLGAIVGVPQLTGWEEVDYGDYEGGNEAVIIMMMRMVLEMLDTM